MTITAYLERIKERLLSDAQVTRVEIVRERSTATDGHLRARLELTNHQWLEFSEYVQRTAQGNIQVVTYSYHWSDENDKLIRRWDNTPHFPHLPNFPHHVHYGPGEVVEPSTPKDIFDVLDEIASTSSKN